MVYVAGIHVLESKYGSIADAMSLVSSLVIAFGPAVITIIGMVIMLSSMFKK